MMRRIVCGMPMEEAVDHIQFSKDIKKAAEMDTEVAEAAERLERLVKVVLQRHRVEQLEDELDKEREALNTLDWVKGLHN